MEQINVQKQMRSVCSDFCFVLYHVRAYPLSYKRATILGGGYDRLPHQNLTVIDLKPALPKTKFHEDSVTRTDAFRYTALLGENVSQQQHTSSAVEREKKRAALMRVIQAIEFHGRLGLPLRGHRDLGSLKLPENNIDDADTRAANSDGNIDYTQGNFRATLQLMMDRNDKVLEQHLLTTSKKATFISPVAQNTLIESLSSVVHLDFIKTIISDLIQS